MMRASRTKLLLFAAITAAIVVVAFYRDRFDVSVLDEWLQNLGVLAPLAFFGLYAIGTVLFAPGSVLTLLGGALFGPVWGTLVNLSGATFGAGIAFLVARYIAGDWVAAKSGGRLKRLVQGVEDEGWRFVAFVRLVPLFPFNLTNYALGLTRIPLLTYVVTSFITMIPGAAAYTWLGYAGREALGGNRTAIQYGLLALALLAAIAVLPRLIRRVYTSDVPWIEAEQFQADLEGAERCLILDVRSPQEFSGELGHIPGAVNIPLDELAGRIDEVLRPSQSSIVTVCRTDRRSSAAEVLLRDAGLHEVKVLRGGMTRWNELGFSTS